MGKLVVKGALMSCSFGTGPGSLTVTRPNITAGGSDAANIQDFAPSTNIPKFVMCNATMNPDVIKNTAAANGVHTPAPCSPATTMPWKPGAKKVLITNQPALDDASTLSCQWQGVISITSAGQVTVDVS
jgi:hypothetical protein